MNQIVRGLPTGFVPQGVAGIPRQRQRRGVRSPKRIAAWIEIASGRSHIPCVLWDISESGARIAAPRAKSLPLAFSLLLTKDGRSRRVCRVAWRSEGYLGVQFVDGTVEDALDAGARRRPPEANGDAVASATPSAATMALLLPGYGAGLLGRIERQSRPASWSAAGVTSLLLAATAVFAVAKGQNEIGAAWAHSVCHSAGNFCMHPEWTGIAAVLMAIVFLSLRGMER